MKQEMSMLKLNLIGGVIAIAAFTLNYFICGRSFGMCLILYPTYVFLFAASLILGIIATISERKSLSGLRGTISLPVGGIFIVLILEPSKIFDIYNILFQLLLL